MSSTVNKIGLDAKRPIDPETGAIEPQVAPWRFIQRASRRADRSLPGKAPY